jgi:hypothetical protein
MSLSSQGETGRGESLGASGRTCSESVKGGSVNVRERGQESVCDGEMHSRVFNVSFYF